MTEGIFIICTRWLQWPKPFRQNGYISIKQYNLLLFGENITSLVLISLSYKHRKVFGMLTAYFFIEHKNRVRKIANN